MRTNPFARFSHTRVFGSSIFRFLRLMFLFPLLLMATARPVFGEDEIPAAVVVHLTGRVEIVSGIDGGSRSAAVGEHLHVGDSVRTGENGKAALLIADETMIQLNHNSLFTLKRTAFSAGWLKKAALRENGGAEHRSVYELESGQMWLRNKNKEIDIEIQTPLVTAGIRGTELDIRFESKDIAYLSVLEGRVSARNAIHDTSVSAMEQVIARLGQPLEKRILLSPEDTVQWVLHLPPVVSESLGVFAAATDSAAIHSPYDRRMEMAHAALMANDFKQAEKTLATLTAEGTQAPAAWILYAQSLLTVGKKREALTAAQKGADLSARSVPALLTLSYAHQALFQLEEALALAEEAARIAPDNMAARLACARLLLALDESEAAYAQLSGLSHQDSAPVQNLRGFILFSQQKTQKAIACFDRAVALDPGLSEPYLGLALARMRLGEKEAAAEAIARAMLLEPRRSLFLCYWGKMLHEMGRPHKALEILEQATSLDPSDPTPWLYRAHILNDLNLSGEALAAYNEAMSRNDNRAVYRSRSLLDKDLAVKNISMANVFWKMGLGDWGAYKAWRSVKMDYANSAAHDFWAWVLHYTSGDTGFADTSEWLKAFLFKPANANTFNTFNDYTIFYEQPDIGGSVSAIAGNHDWREGSLILHGAAPRLNLSYQLDVSGYTRDQWRGGLLKEGSLVRPSLKWDITPRDHLSLKAQLEAVDYGDTDHMTQYGVPSDPENESEKDLGQIDIGYYKRISSRADLVVHARRRYENQVKIRKHQRFFYQANAFDSYPDIRLEEPYTIFQFLQLVRLAGHQIMLGGFQYWSDRDYDITIDTYLDYGGVPLPVASESSRSHKTRRQQSYYLQDIWHIGDSLMLESALYYDEIDNVNSAEDVEWTDRSWNPRIGLLFSPTPSDTFTIAYFRHLDPLQSVARIDPVDVVGAPLASFSEGALFKEFAAGWTHEWSTGIVIARCFDLTLDYDYGTRTAAGGRRSANIENNYQGVEASFNQLLWRRIGLNLGYILLDVTKDESNPRNEGEGNILYGRLSYLHPTGFYAGILQQCFLTRYDNRPDKDKDDFNNTTVYLGYELPKKRGDLRFTVINVFDEHFDGVYLSDISSVFPDTTAWVQMRLFF